ncbi:TIGR03773 family transporter-associated surface protein [Allorhizocola rhizosphaerae]|uniref:TIGR03773 family transporter-associated surface protein n=1 Tax=Allorhizocola rhizosphaerae TaxID=1872709 RepID=UPI0013C2E37B|nr:TIGR03773 family transporter-associated surface protein [Allorhizocola rhizosphaerae]
MRSRFVVAAMLLAGLGLAAPGAAQPPAGGSRLVLHDVHTDVIDMQYTDGRLRLQTRIGSTPYTYKPAEEVIFQLKEAAALQIPDEPQFGFLGAPGDTVWVAPQDPVDGLLYAGWDTQSLDSGVFADDQVQLELKGVSGPGRLEMFQVGPLGEPIRLFSSSDTSYRTQAVPVHTHAHVNWSFTALGRYELTFQAKATLAGGGQVSSDPVRYTWVVGDTVTPTSTQTQLTASVSDRQVTLTATVQPQGAVGWVDFRHAGGSLGHTNVDGGTATLTTTSLPSGTHEITAHFIPKYDNDFAPSVSAPVTVVVEGPPTSVSPSASPSRSPSASPSPSTSQTPSPSATTTPPTSTSPACIPTTVNLPIVDNGHADIASRIVNGRIDIGVKTDAVRDPADVVLHLKPAAAITLPAGFEFLGPAGSTIWQIPQTQRSGIIWLGWNTESVSSPVQWSLTKVSGPGRVAVYEYTSLGQPRIHFNSGDGLPDTFTVAAGTHAHGNWAFTKQGVYKLTFRQQSQSTSDTATVTIVVGDVDPRPHAKRTTGCGGLPRTGDSLTPILVTGTGLLAAGVVLTFVMRRRRAAA